jgi:hypothetical protein
MMAMDPATIALDAATAFLRVPPASVSLLDITASKFPWSTQHPFFMAINQQDRSKLLISVNPDGTAYPFRPIPSVREAYDARINLFVANDLFLAEQVVLPGGLDLAWALRNMIAGLGGWVASQAFFDAEKDALSMWTTLCPQDGPKRFEELCADPVIAATADRWILDFRYFNLSGGVELWHAEGDHRSVLSFAADQVLPNKTFLVPYG